MTARIHILGASGTGTSTLGGNLAERLGVRHFDTDDFFWKKTAVPFSEKEGAEVRLGNLERALDGSEGWVLSGSLCGWGDGLIPRFTMVIYLAVPWEVRRARILAREVARYGEEAISPGGVMRQIHVDFIEWASRYDTAGLEQRSRATHEAWLGRLPGEIAVLRLEGELGPEVLVERVVAGL